MVEAQKPMATANSDYSKIQSPTHASEIQSSKLSLRKNNASTYHKRIADHQNACSVAFSAPVRTMTNNTSIENLEFLPMIPARVHDAGSVATTKAPQSRPHSLRPTERVRKGRNIVFYLDERKLLYFSFGFGGFRPKTLDLLLKEPKYDQKMQVVGD